MTLAEAKRELKNAWINSNECYGDEDQKFNVCYADGTVLSTNEANERLPMKGIIGIQFLGSDSHYAVGYEIYKGEKILIADDYE